MASGYSATAAQAIGYKELIPWLDGEAPLEDCLERIRMQSGAMPSGSSPGSGGTSASIGSSRTITMIMIISTKMLWIIEQKIICSVMLY